MSGKVKISKCYRQGSSLVLTVPISFVKKHNLKTGSEFFREIGKDGIVFKLVKDDG